MLHLQSCPFTVSSLHALNDVWRQINSLLGKKEITWKQRSRVDWSCEDNLGTYYFHNHSHERRRQNIIPSILHESQCVIGNTTI